MKVKTISVDVDVYNRANEILSDIGIDIDTSVSVFLRKVISSRGIPFELRLSNEENTSKFNDVSPKHSDVDLEKLKKTQAGRLYLLMLKLRDEGKLSQKGLFKSKIEEYYRQEYPNDNPRDISQALSDGCSEQYASKKIGVVYERLSSGQRKRTGIYRLKEELLKEERKKEHGMKEIKYMSDISEVKKEELISRIESLNNSFSSLASLIRQAKNGLPVISHNRLVGWCFTDFAYKNTTSDCIELYNLLFGYPPRETIHVEGRELNLKDYRKSIDPEVENLIIQYHNSQNVLSTP